MVMLETTADRWNYSDDIVDILRCGGPRQSVGTPVQGNGWRLETPEMDESGRRSGVSELA